MTEQERCLEAVRHVVHDYANLISSGTMAVQDHHLEKPLGSHINTHVCHAFLVNCRKMCEFFTRKTSTKDDLLAVHFLAPRCATFDLCNWGIWPTR